MTELVEITVHVHRLTRNGVLVSDDGDIDNALWVPRRQCSNVDESDVRKTCTIEMPEWLAQDRGLI